MTITLFGKRRSLHRVIAAAKVVAVVTTLVACDYYGHVEALIRLGMN